MPMPEWLGEAARRSRMLFSRRERFYRDMDEEMRLHRDLRAQEIEAEGASAEEARYAAQRRFGNSLRLREEMDQAWGWMWIDNLRQDLRHGWRMLRRSPLFTLIVVLTLGLGIGANTAIFSVIYAVLLRPLPYPHPEQLVNIFETNLRQGIKAAGCSYQDFQELQRSGIFTSAAGAQRHDLTLTGIGGPAVVTTVSLTPSIFPLLNATPLEGRYLLPADGKKGSAPTVVLSEGLWRTRFGANPDLLGHSIRLDQKGFTVVGIMPAGFRVPLLGDDQQIWIPLVHDPLFGSWIPNRGLHWLRVVGRLPAGASLPKTQSKAEAVSRALAREFPAENSGWAARVLPLRGSIVEDVRTPLLVLLGIAGLVLLLACVNIANLLLARATSRAREMALRHVFGAERGRIVRQLLTESAILGLLGAILGVVLAYGAAHILVSLLPSDFPAAQHVQLNAWVLGYALLISLAASLGFGLAPALLTANSSLQANLKEGSSRSGSNRGRLRMRGLLTRAQIAMAMVLVAGAGLLVRSLVRMTSVNPGFNAAHLVKAEISLPRYQYTTPQQWSQFAKTLLERTQAQPGLNESALGVPLPVADSSVNLRFSIARHAAPAPGAAQSADYVSVSPKYFRVMGIPLLRGRTFSASDSPMAARVAIVSESFARRYFPGENPLGQKLVFGFPLSSNSAREIVGVVGDVRDARLNQEPGPMMYVPFAQAPFWGGELVVKSRLSRAAVVKTIHQVVASIDPELPVTDVASMPDILTDSVSQPRVRTWLVCTFGVLAVLLAVAGVFGVVSYSVASRSQEFGVRSSLGASPASIRNMILKEGLWLASAGLAAGVVAALGLARFLKGELYGVATYDPITFAAGAALLAAAALAACYIPARRAMRVDPMVALRYE